MSDLSRDLDALQAQLSQVSCSGAERIEDAMAARIVAEQWPLQLNNELAAKLADGPFELLQALHRTGQVVDGTLPSDHDLYPDEHLIVSPYYMNHDDPDTLGVWAVEVPGRLKAQLRSVPVLEQAVPNFLLAVQRKGGRYMRAGEQEAEDVVGLLSFVQQHSVIEQIPEPSKGILPYLSSLASRLIRRKG